MGNELQELLDTAIYREVASQALYEAGQNKTEDAGAKALMKELAKEEQRHAKLLTGLKDRKWTIDEWHSEKLPDIRISEYLNEIGSIEGIGFQETLVLAMKREQHAVEFYSRMMSVFRAEDAKKLCENLVYEELKHKRRLELSYDDIFYRSD